MALSQPIPEEIMKSLEARENLYKSEEKTPDSLTFIHGRSSFVIVRSLVTLDGSFDLAKSAALTSGIGFKGREGIDREPNKNLSNSEAAYYQSEVFGFKPMPGITNINTSFQGLGATGKTVVSYTVHSPEDLDIVNKLYMTLGATVMVEFGHTVYISKDGEIKTMTLGDIVPVDDFFKKEPSLNDLRTKIDTINKDTNYNYEGLVGRVSNFNFTFDPNGSYNCTMEITSYNSVIDALKPPNVIDNVKNVKPSTKGDQAEANVPKGFNNVVDYICASVERYNKKQGKVNCRELFDDPNVNLSSLKDWVNKYDAYISTVPAGGEVTQGNEAEGISNVKGNFLAFFPLRFWLELFNIFAMPKTGDKKEDYIARWGTESMNYRSFKFMYSHNPSMVQLPRKASGVTSGFNVKGGKSNYRGSDLIDVNEPSNERILEIRVSTELLKKVNSVFIGNNSRKNDEIGLTDYVELLLQEIQKYMGDINSFEIVTSPRPIDGIYEELMIYDKSGKSEPGTFLNISGLSTTVMSIGIKSNISGDMQMAAMFGGAGKKGEGGKTQASIERHNTKNGEEEVEDALMATAFSDGTELTEGKGGDKPEAEDTESGEEVKAIIQEQYDEWNAGKGSQFEEILDSSIDYVKSLVGGKALGRFMPTPVDLDIEMLGIGGFKNLETIRIPDHLVPPRFGNENFQVTGIEHSLDAGDPVWKTSITAQIKSL
jgi:hypothetical protein